jgi:hypothetical protein
VVLLLGTEYYGSGQVMKVEVLALCMRLCLTESSAWRWSLLDARLGLCICSRPVAKPAQQSTEYGLMGIQISHPWDSDLFPG